MAASQQLLISGGSESAAITARIIKPEYYSNLGRVTGGFGTSLAVYNNTLAIGWPGSFSHSTGGRSGNRGSVMLIDKLSSDQFAGNTYILNQFLQGGDFSNIGYTISLGINNNTIESVLSGNPNFNPSSVGSQPYTGCICTWVKSTSNSYSLRGVSSPGGYSPKYSSYGWSVTSFSTTFFIGAPGMPGYNWGTVYYGSRTLTYTQTYGRVIYSMMFGSDVVVDTYSNTLIVGVPRFYNIVNSAVSYTDGCISIYSLANATNPIEVTKIFPIIPANTTNGTKIGFGAKIAVSQDKLAILASAWTPAGSARPSGAIFIYKRTGPGVNWIQDQILIGPNIYDMYNKYADFGMSILFYKDRLFVGAPSQYRDNKNNNGTVYEYKLDNTNKYVLESTITPPSNISMNVSGSKFGISLAADSNTVYIGAPVLNTVFYYIRN